MSQGRAGASTTRWPLSQERHAALNLHEDENPPAGFVFPSLHLFHLLRPQITAEPSLSLQQLLQHRRTAATKGTLEAEVHPRPDLSLVLQ